MYLVRAYPRNAWCTDLGVTPARILVLLAVLKHVCPGTECCTDLRVSGTRTPQGVHTLFLDTTYCSPQHDFPPQVSRDIGTHAPTHAHTRTHTHVHTLHTRMCTHCTHMHMQKLHTCTPTYAHTNVLATDVVRFTEVSLLFTEGARLFMGAGTGGTVCGRTGQSQRLQ